MRFTNVLVGFGETQVIVVLIVYVRFNLESSISAPHVEVEFKVYQWVPPGGNLITNSGTGTCVKTLPNQ